jgi:hypothetical protein
MEEAATGDSFLTDDDSDLAEFDAYCLSRRDPISFPEAAAKARRVAQELGITIYLVSPDDEARYAAVGEWTLSRESRDERITFIADHAAQRAALHGGELPAVFNDESEDDADAAEWPGFDCRYGDWQS